MFTVADYVNFLENKLVIVGPAPTKSDKALTEALAKDVHKWINKQCECHRVIDGAKVDLDGGFYEDFKRNKKGCEKKRLPPVLDAEADTGGTKWICSLDVDAARLIQLFGQPVDVVGVTKCSREWKFRTATGVLSIYDWVGHSTFQLAGRDHSEDDVYYLVKLTASTGGN